MYRILTASKDAYITDKIVVGSRSIDSNVGQASTLDVFKLYSETTLSGTSAPIELSRALIKFDYTPLQALTSSILNVSGNTFQAYLHLKNVYGGQTTPSNFTLQIHPLAKDWSEGVGQDVVYFKDVDAVNWITASVNPAVALWTTSGAFSSGAIGETCDFYVSGNIGVGSQSLSVTQSFPRGDEDLYVDVSSLVSASVWANLPNNGFRISFIPSQEQDQTTRFVKRFGSRNVNNKAFQPKLYVKYNGNLIQDDTTQPLFEEQNRFHIYNLTRGTSTNFRSGTVGISGSNCLMLELIASKSQIVAMTSWSQSHSQSITFYTSSVSYFSSAFTGSQLMFGGLQQSGSYYSDVTMSPQMTSSLNAFVSASGYAQSFLMLWKSLDRTVLYASGGYLNFSQNLGSNSSFDQRNYVVNITNLEQNYTKSESSKMRVFVQDWEFNFSTKRLPTAAISKILKNMQWSLVDPYSKEVIVPFDPVGTKLSSDGQGMFFDFWFTDLDVNRVYEFEFKIEENGATDLIVGQGFRFKVVGE